MNILVDATDLNREDAVKAAQAVYLLKTLEAKGLKFLLAEDDATDGEPVSFCKPPDTMKAFIKENPEEFERVAAEADATIPEMAQQELNRRAFARATMTREEANAHNDVALQRRLASIEALRQERASSYKGPVCSCGERPHRAACPAAR